MGFSSLIPVRLLDLVSAGLHEGGDGRVDVFAVDAVVLGQHIVAVRNLEASVDHAAQRSIDAVAGGAGSEPDVEHGFVVTGGKRRLSEGEAHQVRCRDGFLGGVRGPSEAAAQVIAGHGGHDDVAVRLPGRQLRSGPGV
jgi:hypothetical protein